MTDRPLLRRVPGGWWLDAALLFGFVALTVALIARTPLLQVDLAVADWCDAHRPDLPRLASQVLVYLGQRAVLAPVALAMAAWRVRRFRSVRPLLPVAVTFVMLDLVIGSLKLLTGRAAPHADRVHREWLFDYDHGMSYPSGHVANALVWYVAIVIVLGAALPAGLRRVLLIVPMPLIIVVTTYLGWHWITDDIAGALLGVVGARVLLRIRWDAVPLGSWISRRGWGRPAGLDQGPLLRVARR